MEYEHDEVMAAFDKALDLKVLKPWPEPPDMAQYHEWIQKQIANAGWTHEGGGIYHKTTRVDQPWVVPEWD